MQLNALQQQLEHVYDLNTQHQVEDFLLLDPLMASCLANIDTPGDEQLLLRENEDGLEVSLFLRKALLDRLLKDDPLCALHTGNLADYCLAIEGVSHFLHLVWNADHNRCISQLELELLAEIDKFVTTATLIRQQTGRSQSPQLHHLLFQACSFRDDLQTHCRQRYYEANRLAALYCKTLQDRFELVPDEPRLQRELRRFQRLSKLDKFHRIECHSQVS